MSAKDVFLAELAASLRGPRRSRLRLLKEVEAHLDDTVSAGVSRGLELGDAETEALAQLGRPTVIAEPWNHNQRSHQRARRRKLSALVLAVGGAGALAVTQYAAGKGPRTPAFTCANSPNRATTNATSSPGPLSVTAARPHRCPRSR